MSVCENVNHSTTAAFHINELLRFLIIKVDLKVSEGDFITSGYSVEDERMNECQVFSELLKLFD